MANYKKMYTTLFNTVTDTITSLESLSGTLKSAQQLTEDMYTEGGDSNITPFCEIVNPLDKDGEDGI